MPGWSSGSRVGRGRLARTALVSVMTVVGLLAAPGTASAADTVTPVLNCTTPAAGGGFTAVVGYDNGTGRDVTIPFGKQNRIVPGKYDGAQPTVLAAGRHDGAFTVAIKGDSAKWKLGDMQLLLTPAGAPACPSATELPEEGNGTGPAIALLGAGVFGAVAVQRIRRRALVGAGAPTGEDRDDA